MCHVTLSGLSHFRHQVIPVRQMDHTVRQLRLLHIILPVWLPRRSPSQSHSRPCSLQVLYLDVLQDVEYERLILLQRMLWEELREAELVSIEDKAFTPHLTVAKLSAMRGKRKHASIRKIPPVSSRADACDVFLSSCAA